MKVEFNNRTYDASFWMPSVGSIGKLFALDTETTPIEAGEIPRFVIGQAYAGRKEVYLIKQEHLAAFMDVHKDADIVMHNAPFDIAVIEKAAGFSFEAQIENNKVWDTGILYQLLVLANDGTISSWKLSYLCKKLLKVDLPKDKEVRNGFGKYILADGSIDYGQMTEEEIAYAARDAIATNEIFGKLIGKVHELDRNQYLSHRYVLMGAIGLHAAKLNGCEIDMEMRDERLDSFNKAKVAHLARINEFGYVPGEKGNKKILQNLLSQTEKRLGQRFPRTEKTGSISSKREDLCIYRSNSKFIDEYLSFKESKVLCDFMMKLDAPRIYPTYTVINRTGRTSCRKPNVQNIPKSKDAGIRGCFVAKSGHKLLCIDYSGIELCTLAQECFDRYGSSKMGELINEGVDLHRWFASRMLNKPVEQVTKEERQRAKACNFGMAGGLGAPRLQEYAQSTYGVAMTLQEATRYRQAWIEAFPEMKLYLADDQLARLKGMYEFKRASYHLGDWAEEDMAAKMFMRIICGETNTTSGKTYSAKTLAWVFDIVLPEIRPDLKRIKEGSEKLKKMVLDRVSVQTRTGRIRANCSYTQARNCPFQGLASDGAKIALYRLYRAGYRVVGFIHDEFLVELFDDDQLGKHAEEIERIIIAAMKEVVPDVVIRAEKSISDRWVKP